LLRKGFPLGAPASPVGFFFSASGSASEGEPQSGSHGGRKDQKDNKDEKDKG